MKLIYVLYLTSTGFILIDVWIVLFRHFWMFIDAKNFLLRSNNFFSNFCFFFIVCLISFNIIAFWPWFHRSFVKRSVHIYTNILFGLRVESLTIFCNVLLIVSFLFCKRKTQTYLLKTSITYKKKCIPSLYLFNNCILAKPIPHILFIKDEHNLSFKDFIMIGLRN